MTRYFIKSVKTRKVFPPRNKLAAMMARISVLREDSMVEMLAIEAENMGTLDRPNERVRKLYFLRNLIRTHAELSSAIQTLLSNQQFRDLLARQPAEMRAEFNSKLPALKSHPILKEVRNDICAHVLQKAVESALNRMDDSSSAFFQVGDSGMHAIYGFASEVVAKMLLKGVRKRELTSRLGSLKFRQLRAALDLTPLADACLIMYLSDRGIFPW